MTIFSWWSHEDTSTDELIDNRVLPRADAFIELTLCSHDEEYSGCHTLNISAKGVLIELPHSVEITMGSTVDLRFHIWTGRDHISRFLRASVVRYDEHGLAVSFTDHDLATQAVVQDILYYQQYERRREVRDITARVSMRGNITSWFARLMA